jgi:hypothetical protein
LKVLACHRGPEHRNDVPAAKRGITAQIEEQRHGPLRLPGALLVTVLAQLLAAFVTVNLCLAALFE